MTWKLWLDDERDPHEWLVMSRVFDAPLHPEMAPYLNAGLKADDFVWAKSTAAAIALVTERGLPDYLALDFNLGARRDVFEFLDWLEPMVTKPIAGRCHSSSWNARREVDEVLARFGKLSVSG